MIKVIAKSHVRSGQLDRVLELSEEMVRETVKEHGCIRYELLQDMKDPNVLIFLEEWESEKALEDHMASEHFRRLIPQVNELREKASEVSICKRVF